MTGLAELAEMTSFCGTSGGSNRGMSVYGVGLVLNTSALTGGLVGDAQSKYNDLSSTVAAANIVPATKTSVNACLSNVNSYLSQADYVCAANEAVQCDTLVGQDPSPATNYPGNAANPNPWGEIRGRLGNLYLALNTRVSGNPRQLRMAAHLAAAGLCSSGRDSVGNAHEHCTGQRRAAQLEHAARALLPGEWRLGRPAGAERRAEHRHPGEHHHLYPDVHGRELHAHQHFGGRDGASATDDQRLQRQSGAGREWWRDAAQLDGLECAVVFARGRQPESQRGHESR